MAAFSLVSSGFHHEKYGGDSYQRFGAAIEMCAGALFGGRVDRSLFGSAAGSPDGFAG